MTAPCRAGSRPRARILLAADACLRSSRPTSPSATRCRSISIPRSTPGRSTSPWRSSATRRRERGAARRGVAVPPERRRTLARRAGKRSRIALSRHRLPQPRKRWRDDRRRVRRAAAPAGGERGGDARHADDRRQRSAERVREPAARVAARPRSRATSQEAYELLVDAVRRVAAQLARCCSRRSTIRRTGSVGFPACSRMRASCRSTSSTR